MHYDNSQVMAPLVAIAAAVLDADPVPPTVDLVDGLSATLVIAVGAGGITFSGTNKIEFRLTHSDDDSTYTDVEAGDVEGATVGANGAVKVLNAAHAAATVTVLGYTGGKRYLKLLPKFLGTHGTGTPMSATVLVGHRHAIAPA